MQLSQVQTLSPRMEQKLIMTRQMIQSIEMLQLPVMDLQQNLGQELSANPWLDLVEGEETAEAPARKKEKEAAPPRDDEPQIRRMEALVEEWNDSSTRGRGLGRFLGEEDAKLEALSNTPAPGTSLEEHLRLQLHLSKEEPGLKRLAEVIIGSLDDAGFLQTPLIDLFYETEDGIRRPTLEEEVSEEDAELALELVQSFDPPGVGARDLKECLRLQLQRLGGDTHLEEQVVERHLEDLSHNRLPRIAKELNLSLERVKEARTLISHLNPRPGRGFGGGRPQYVVPDVIVEELDGRLEIRVNERALPRLRVSRESLALLRAEPKGSPVRDYILGKLGGAVWVMEAVIQRRQTLRRIAEQLVETQKDFFAHGPAHLKPLMMQEIAERVGMHVSTISRALSGKYIQTPHGLLPMRYFFTGGFSTEDGESESNRAVMLKIQQMVQAEEKGKPLSDQELVARLKAEGLDIARRTVAKYREKLNIPSSRQRRSY